MNISRVTSQALACTFLFLFLMLAETNGQVKPASLTKNNWINVILTKDMADHLRSLDNVEKMEQYRDWIKLSAVYALRFNKATNFEVFYDFNPLRTDYGRNISNYNFGEGRSIQAPKDSLYIIVPVESNKKTITIAHLADNFRLITGRKPKAVSLIEYKIDTASRSASFAYTTDLVPSELFSEKYGYIENTVNSRTDLTALLNRVDDVVFAALQGDMLYLGGRRYPGYQGKKIDLEDIAVIYQAGNKMYENEIERITNRGLIAEYDKRIRDLITYNINKDARFLLNFSMAELEEQARQKFSYNAFVSDYLNATKKRADELNVGFSLDPAIKYRDMYMALDRILQGDTSILRQLFRNEIEKDLTESYLEKNKGISEGLAVYGTKEKSLRTLSGLDSTAEKDFGEDGQSLAAYLEKNYRMMVKAVRKNKPVLLQIARQLNEEKEGKELLLYYYLSSYMRGEYTLDIRGPVNDQWSAEKKAIYNRATADLTEALYHLGFLRSGTSTGYTVQVMDALKQLNTEYGLGLQDVRSLDEKKLNYIISLDTTKWDEIIGMDLFLENIVKPYRYQKARYDGDFQGTKIGMTLFYTDLVMKLWSFNYRNSFPYSVPGFYPETNYKFSRLYLEEIKKNPYTRSWLGPLLSGMEMYNNGKQVYFSHTATRIYNASSNDLAPGIEVPAHVSSDRFSNWWNLHYEEVADHETEYQRLNQIMKWSFLIAWLKTNNKMDWLSQETGLTRNLEFSTWYQANNTLKVKVDIPFLDKRRLKEKTECLDILVSRPFQWFKESGLEYIFSGGISLVNKRSMLQKMGAIKNPLITNRPLNRSGLVSVQNDVNNFTILETKYSVNPSQAKAVIAPGKTAGFKGRETEFFNLKISRSVNTSPARMEINQLAGEANAIPAGGVRAEKNGNGIVLSALQDDVNTYKRFFVNDDLYKRISISEKKIYLDDKSFILKLDNTDCWAIGKQIKESETGRWISTSTQPRFNYVDGSLKYDVQLVNDADMASGSLRNGWFKIRKGVTNDVQYGQHSPQAAVNKLIFHDGVRRNEVFIEPDGMFIRKTNFQTDEAVAHALSSNGGSSILNAITYDKSKAYILAGDNFVKLAKDMPADLADLVVLKKMLPAQQSSLKALVVDPAAAEIKFIGRGVIKVPEVAKWTPEQKETIQFVLQKSTDANWMHALEYAGKITREDVQVISKIQQENHALVSSYYKMKSSDLDEATALVDVQSVSKQPQMVIKTGSGNPEIKTVTAGPSMNEIMTDINKMYTEPGPITTAEFLRRTKPAADFMDQVCSNTTAKKIITIEPEKSRLGIYKQLHDVHPDKIIVKDQPDLAASIRNANKNVSVHFEKAAFMMTAEPDKDRFVKTKELIDSLGYYGMKVTVNLTSKEFLRILKDSSISQMNLVVRGNDLGLIFSDNFLSYWKLRTELSYIYRTRKKDLIYIVSNVASTLESIFTSYPMFTRIVTSTFVFKDKESFESACANMKALYSKAYHEKITIPAAAWKSMVEADPDLKSSVGNMAKQSRKQVTVSIGKMDAGQLNKIPKSLWSYITEKLGSQAKPYSPKNFDNLLQDVRVEKLQELKTKPVSPAKFIQSIPDSKVMNKPAAVSSAC